MSWLFTSDGQSIGASASALVLPMNILGLISFRIDWLDFLAIEGTLKSLLQHHNSKASILQRSAFFMVQLSHLDMTTGKTIVLHREVCWLRMSAKCVTPRDAGGAETPWAGGLPFKGPSGVGGAHRDRCLPPCFCADLSIREELAPGLGNSKKRCLQRELADSSKLDTCLLYKKNEAVCSLRWQPKGHRSFN